MTLSLSMPAQATATAPTMRAAIFERFGGPEVVRVTEIATPRPGPKDVLIRVAASTVSAADHRMRARDLPRGLGLLALPVVGLFRPRRRVLGMDFAGTVEAVGADVTRFRPGDEIVGLTGSAFGGHAEFVVLPETAAMAPKPEGLGHEDAVALVFGGHTISECIRRCPIRPGDEVLVNGAAGAVGSAAVQVARHFGARVSAVTSAGNADLVASLGADRVIDYRAEDFAAEDHRYDVIFECVGNAPFERVDRVLEPGGALLQVVVDLKALLGAKGNSRRSGKRVIPINFTPSAEDVAFAIGLYREGGLKPVIDRKYRFDDIVAAHRYVDTGRKRGSVILQVASSMADVVRDQGDVSGQERRRPLAPTS
jgi:NADPH:quinone reductase-like Zn-dependent oxidoreductase